MGDRRAPSPPPGEPDYRGPAQVKPEPPPAPPTFDQVLEGFRTFLRPSPEERGALRPDRHTPETWEQIKARALHCATLHYAVALVEGGYMNREQALTSAALALSTRVEALTKQCADLMARLPAIYDLTGSLKGFGPR